MLILSYDVNIILVKNLIEFYREFFSLEWMTFEKNYLFKHFLYGLLILSKQ